MPSVEPAFGGMFRQLIELGVVGIDTEPLDDGVERRLKTIWEDRSCPDCGADSLHALNGSDRIWCGRCNWKTTYTRGIPFYDSELTPGEFLIAVILYADTLLSKIAALFSPCYTTLYDQLRELETALCRDFPTVWEMRSQTVDGPTQVDETLQVCSGCKGQEPPWEGPDSRGSPEGGRTRWTGDQGDEMTLIAACRDVLRVVAAQEGSGYEADLEPVIEEANDLSRRPGEVWTDGLPAYRGMEYDHR
jgi:ribosomal protein S27AE